MAVRCETGAGSKGEKKDGKVKSGEEQKVEGRAANGGGLVRADEKPHPAERGGLRGRDWRPGARGE